MSGFLQIELNEPSSFLKIFHTLLGQFRWLSLPFGVKCAPVISQRIMDQILEGISGTISAIDDTLIAAPTEQEHNSTLCKVVERATATTWSSISTNTTFAIRQCRMLDTQSLLMAWKSDPVKMEAIQNMPPLLVKEGLKRFLSFITYKFIANFSQVDAPLCQLLQRDVEFARQPVQQSTFDRLKELCTLPPVLKYFNPAKPVVIFCDASSNRRGAVLL